MTRWSFRPLVLFILHPKIQLRIVVKLWFTIYFTFLAPSELLKWRCRSVGLSVCLSVGPHVAFQQHFVHVAALFSLVQSGLDYYRPIQSTLVKSSHIYSNLENSFLGYFWQHIAHVAAIYSLVMSRLDQTSEDQFSLLQSNLVKSSQTQSNLVKSR